MALILLDANPILAAGGQIAAIILCVFLLITVLLTLAINLGLAFGLSWLREKITIIKMLRPTVDSVNKSSEAALQGKPNNTAENKIVRTAASVPGGVHTAEQKVEQVSEKVAQAVIEFRARTVQVQTIARAFLAPATEGRHVRQYRTSPARTTDAGKLVEEQLSPALNGTVSPDGAQQVITVSQERHAPTR